MNPPPRNLLRVEITAPEIAAILRRQRDARLLPACGSDPWQAAFAKPPVQRWLATIRPLAESARETPLPALPDDLYADYHRTGTRIRFEKPYFARRRAVAHAAILVLAEGGSWLPSLIAKVEDIMAEVSWALPAHVRATSGKDPGVIDLFGAETANLMGELITLFGALLPAELVARITARLEHDFFLNLLERKFWWQTTSNNWNGVCHQGVIGAALAVADDDLTARLLIQARAHLPMFLSGFPADGGCTEGPSYWVHGFGWFTELNRQLETRSGGELSLFADDPHILEIARYAPRVALANNHVVNFSDCSPTMLMRPDFLVYLGDRLQEPTVRDLGYANYQQLATGSPRFQDNRSDLFLLTRLFLRCPADLAQPVTVATPSHFFPGLGVLVARGADRAGHRWEFAAKAGHNDEHHNHNDCGSYLLNIDGQRLLIEIGAPEYTRELFGPQRSEFLAVRTRGHSLPVINGCEQAAGRDFAAQILDQQLTADGAKLVIDLTACYPAEAHCRRCVRSLEWDRAAGRLTVRDEFELTQTLAVETAIITEADLKVSANTAELRQQRVALAIATAPGTVIAVVETPGYHNHNGDPAQVNRLVLRPTAISNTVALGYTVTVAPGA